MTRRGAVFNAFNDRIVMLNAGHRLHAPIDNMRNSC
jgi:hypothetical protein